LIELSRIHPDPMQPRRNLEESALRELVESVKRLGILQPISVRYMADADQYQIISGERRFQAATLAGLSEIPCWVQSPEEREILVRQIVENWQRAELHPFELADSLAALRDTNGYSQKQIAELTGKSEGEISKLLKLLTLAPDVQLAARSDSTGTLSRRHLYAVSRLSQEEQVIVATTVQDQSLTAEDTEAMVSKKLSRQTKMPKRGAPVTRVQYVTAKARIVLTFRKQSVTPADIMAALDEARAKADPAKRDLNIERIKS
jgi:ParB family chromosome partitioning protein